MADYGWRAFITDRPGDWHRDEIKRLTRERDRVTSQLEKLIDGIGRLGGNNA